MLFERFNKGSTILTGLSAYLEVSVLPFSRGLVRRLMVATAPLTFSAVLLLTPAGQLAWGDTVPAPSSERVVLEAAENLSAQGAESSYELGVGDRLRIKIYEREDLSGESVVRVDGSLVVPLLGALKAAGTKVSALEKEIREALFKLTAKTGFVSVDVIEWRKIFTVGVVAKPGTYPFVPRMTALHALAAAGGFHRPSETTYLVLESSREVDRHQRSKEKLSNALGREARALAQIAGQEKAGAPRRLVELVGALEAERIMAAEKRLMSERLAHHQRLVDSLDEAINLADKEIAATQAQYSRARSLAQVANEELVEVIDYAKRKLTNRARLFDAKRTAVAAEGEVRAVLAMLARSQRELVTSKRSRTMLDANRKLQLEEELKRTREEVRKHDHEMRASAELLQRISGGKLASNGDIRATYKIMRLVAGRQVMIDSEAKTALQPGNLVRVSLPPIGLSCHSRPWLRAQSATH